MTSHPDGAPSLSVSCGRPRAKLVASGSDLALARAIVELLNDPSSFASRVVPLSHERVEASRTGTRSLTGTLDLDPERIFRFSGVGVVRSTTSKEEARRGLPEGFIVDPPEPDTPVSRHIKMGTMVVDADGAIYGLSNHSPFGAYPAEDALEKAALTERYAGPNDARIVAAGRFEDRSLGWLVYSLPKDVLTPIELIHLDLNRPRSEIGSVFGPMLHALLGRARRLHDEGVVHRQLHPGNWFARWEDGRPTPSITDWGTVRSIDSPKPLSRKDKARASKRSQIEEQLTRLSPAEKAKALDLMVALSSAGLLDQPLVQESFDAEEAKRLPVVFSSMEPTLDAIEYQLRLLAYAVLGYLGQAPDREQVARLETVLGARFRALAVDGFSRTGYARPDASFEDVLEFERSKMILAPAMTQLHYRLVRAMVSMPAEDLLADLLGDGRSIRGPWRQPQMSM